MAYGDKHIYVYHDDDGTEMGVRMSEQKAAFDGFVQASTALPMWTRPAKWLRHVGVKAPNGKVRQYPCKDTQGKYKQIGTDSHTIKVFNQDIANCKIVGRTGEKGGS